ncbi:MAG: hypothetical protein IPK16_28285 [Anaerolineales bacterium]|nr:hypothetical protein [Anaerolineales bacterium]
MDVVLHFYLPVLAPAKVLIACGTDADLAAASVRLARAADIARRTHNNHLLIQVKVLEATLAETLGDRERALAALTEAVGLAEPGAAQRPFLDQGPNAGRLIGMLHIAGVEQDFVERLHRAFIIEHGVSDVHVGKPPEPAASRQSEHMKPVETSEPGSNDLRVMLTNRELDILYLLLQRLTNKEIARNLGISTETVKGHLVSLFRKLEVKRRRARRCQ